MRIRSLCCLLLLACKVVVAQDSLQYVPAKDLQLIGRALPERTTYTRVDSTDYRAFPVPVQQLSRHSAGIAVLFESNSTFIKARWKVAPRKQANNLTPVAQNGLDLYAFHKGQWQYVGVGRPTGESQDQIIIQRMNDSLKQFMLYLPLYNELTDLEIGVAANAVIRRPAKARIDTTKRIVVYGSSIAQGSSASRPGMAYPAIMSRHTGWEFINLGFSGNAKMELPLAEWLAKVPASCYILDCIPNPSPEEITARAYPFIKHLRTQQPNVPIVIIETVIREISYFDQQWTDRVKRQNEAIRQAYERLKKEGYQHLYYIPAKGLSGDDHEATIDGTHLTDLGFMRFVDKVLPVVKKAVSF